MQTRRQKFDDSNEDFMQLLTSIAEQYRHTNTYSQKDRHTHTHSQIDIYTHTDSKIDRHAHTHTHPDRHSHTETDTDSHIHRRTARQTDRYTRTQADRQINGRRHLNSHNLDDSIRIRNKFFFYPYLSWCAFHWRKFSTYCFQTHRQ